MDLARALVEHPMWRWEPGMVDTDGRVAVCGKSGIHGRPMMGKTVQVGPFLGGAVDYVDDARPDINHPATKGWMLHMLREVSDFCPYAIRLIDGFEDGAPVWCVYDDNDDLLADARTEGEALAAALLAAWGDAA